jgi:acetylornithine deacetylase/succinyl-diaminopimelate desuccinylase-like protein
VSARDKSGASGPVKEFLRAHRNEIVDELKEWVRIPSIAALPEHADDVQRSARWLAGRLRALGFDTRLVPTGDSVAVLAERRVADDLPTVLVYSHHDVRHAKPQEWLETSPFEPVLRDGRLYGRGASDAKGQVLAHLWGLAAHLQHRDEPAVNLVVLVEGEEEMGSPHFARLLEDEAEALACDCIVFSDTLQWKEGNPAVVTSMRGMLSATVSVSGPRRDVHSGAVSGVSPNPSQVLVEVLAKLHDDEGRIALPGLYDDVDALDEKRASELAELSFDDEVWLHRTESRSMTGEHGLTAKERLWARPSLEILSLLAGDPEGVPRAVIPSEATAEINIRTVPHQSVAAVARQLREFFEEQMPPTVEYRLQVDEESGQEPYVTPEGPALDALHRAAAAGHGADVAGRMGNAGGGPAELLSRMLGAPVLFVGTGLPEDHWHSSDESIDVGTLLDGAATIARLWTELGVALDGGGGR